jgi:hypothetical protein
VFEEEDGDAIVGSPRGEQHIPLVKCRFHHKSSQNDQADADRLAVETPRFSTTTLAHVHDLSAMR